jgi:putative flippase GtrA
VTAPHISKKLLSFLLTGGIAALINFLSRILYNHWLNFSISIVLAYITGMLAAFILMKSFVFTSSRKSLKHSALLFTLVNILAIFQTWLVSVALAYYLLPFLGVEKFNREIAHAAGIAVPVFTSYICHKRWTFPE